VDLQLTGKKALVTGASRGIGRAIARQLALEGCDVAICARTEERLKQAATDLAKESGRKVVPIACDTLNADAIKRFVDTAARELGGIHIVINNAARVGGTPGTVENVSDADVLRDFEEKVVGYLRTVQAAVPYLKQAGWGRVVNISGGAGRAPGTAVSGGIRNIATVNLTKSMANALGPYGINVNAIAPATTLTERIRPRWEQRPPEERKADIERTPLRRMGEAVDQANVICFLASAHADFVTGLTIDVTGGL
jgi:NAD(P)-dependent dehydrogenase (short-subunit alcohol dehydrogenase family)